MMEGMQTQLTVGERSERVRRLAFDRFRREPDWVSFYREVLGVNGIVDSMFPSYEERCQFEQTEIFAEIQKQVARLRVKNRVQRKPDEATKVITVRLPESMHDALRAEAHNHRTSMNRLCISKLLQVIDSDLVPSDVDGSKGSKGSTTPTTTTTPPTENRLQTTAPAMAPEPQPPQQPTLPQPTHFMGGGRPF